MPPTHYQAPQPSSQVLVTNNQINIQQYNDIYLHYQSEKMPILVLDMPPPPLIRVADVLRLCTPQNEIMKIDFSMF